MVKPNEFAQTRYDGLVLYKNSLIAQIEVLEKSPDVCTHKKTEDSNGVTFCAICHKALDTHGNYDVVSFGK